MTQQKTENDEAMFLRGRAFWAERLDLCPVTLLRAYKRGELDAYRVGDRVLHSPDQIREWVEGRRRRKQERERGGAE